MAATLSLAMAGVGLASDGASCDRTAYYLSLGQYDRALRSIAGAPSNSPTTSPADRENMRGLALLMKGDAKSALTAFGDALEIDGKHFAAAFNRGLAELKLGDYRKAADRFAGVFADSASPYRAYAAYHRAIALDRLGLRAEAEEWLDRALKADPQLNAALLYKGLLRERANDMQGAGRAYFEYIKRNPESAIAHLRFGITAIRAGRSDAGRTYLQRVIKIAPDSPEAVEARKYLVMWE